MRIKFFYLTSVFLFSLQIVSAQFIQAYKDSRDYFYVFEDGMPRQLETQKVKSFEISDDALVYVNNGVNLKGFYHGEKYDLGEGNNLQLNSTRKFITIQRGQALYVFDHGITTRLTNFMKEYKQGAEILVYKDDNFDMLKAYINGAIVEIEYTLVGDLGNYKAGVNLVAYTDQLSHFKVFCNGEVQELEEWAPVKFECGRDMVAYVDGTTQNLKLYYHDKILKLEDFPPESMQMGDSVFAYVSVEGEFKVFSKGKLLKVESYAPAVYVVKDKICLFFTENKLQAMLNGVRYQLDNFNPQSYQISNNCVAWLDNSGRLKMFDNGKVVTVTTEIVGAYTLNGDILKFVGGDNQVHIFYNGKNF